MQAGYQIHCTYSRQVYVYSNLICHQGYQVLSNLIKSSVVKVFQSDYTLPNTDQRVSFV